MVKFKAKHDSGYWLTAELSNDGNDNYGIMWHGQNGDEPFARINPNTICVATGLRDSNDADIYVGDLLKVTDDETGSEIYGVSVWFEKSAYVVHFPYGMGSTTLFELLMRDGKTVVVQGNRLDDIDC